MPVGWVGTGIGGLHHSFRNLVQKYSSESYMEEAVKAEEAPQPKTNHVFS